MKRQPSSSIWAIIGAIRWRSCLRWNITSFTTATLALDAALALKWFFITYRLMGEAMTRMTCATENIFHHFERNPETRLCCHLVLWNNRWRHLVTSCPTTYLFSGVIVRSTLCWIKLRSNHKLLSVA